MRLKDRAAIVTGAASGIGKATAQLFAAEGARVLAVDLPGKDLAAAHAGVTGITPLEADITAPDAPQRIVDTALSACGQLDIVMNNAGVSGREFVEEMKRSTWDRVLAVNLTASWRLIRSMEPLLKASDRGRAIFLTSGRVARPKAFWAAYAASKAGLSGLTKGCAAAWGHRGVRVNAVAPGLIDTEILDVVAEDKRQTLIDATPLGRIGTPEDVAEMVLYLLSDRSNFVTGQTMVVCGGRAMVP
jgi:NAD(P)-dependent dehydrogenase (short-subunit alcohol dehydrogenase family)